VREGLNRPLWLVLVIAAFCLPLFIGLGRTDVENDEAIYSFAVDGILAHGDWLNPPSSPHNDVTFLEKPPLKFWIVAAPIRAGLLPHDEAGLRFWDALFGAVGFLYVFGMGRRLAGPLCGIVAVSILFAYDPLLFEHGLRGNNMEAPLFLCYCGGVYHFIRWGTEADARRRGRHVMAAGLYFFLGFMTKFVAAIFLPIVVAAAVLPFRGVRERLAADWRAWARAAAVFLLLAAPWFVYESFRYGEGFWHIILGTHVVERFTSYLDPAHLHPWNYYYVTIWHELRNAQVAWLVAAGAVLGAVQLVRERRLDMAAVLSWAVIPLALISFGTSKLPHYVYPFLPPLALLGGLVPAWIVRGARPYVERAVVEINRIFARRGRGMLAVQRVLLGIAAVAFAIAIVTLVTGSVNLRLGGAQILRNSHVARPLIVALVLATLAGRGIAVSRVIVPAVVLLAVMPLDAYKDTLRKVPVERHPLRTAGECLTRVADAEREAGRPAPGIYAVGEQRWFLHDYFYYLSRSGGWDRAEALDVPTVERALFDSNYQRPVMLDDADYRALRARDAEALGETAVIPLREVLLVLPGPYGVCGQRPGSRAAGARPAGTG
jgi:4-amino-4-deoxy-L-arabinose transferase-like glycosyltransferase